MRETRRKVGPSPRKNVLVNEHSRAALDTIDPATIEPMPDEIARRAYQRYEERGRQDGYALDDWLRAETELREQQLQTIIDRVLNPSS